MNLLRNTLKKRYSQIPNELVTDLSISAGELRVLLYLFTKPDDWSVYNKDICKQLGISEQTLTKYWKKLITSKWLRREIAHSKDGKLTGGYVYHIGTFDRICTNTVSIHSTETVNSIDHSNTKPINKDLTYTNTKVATHLFNKIKQVKPNFKAPNIKQWTKDIDLAIRIDERTEAELIGCIDWIYSTNKGSFWIPNIMSGKKLREKFDTMELQMMKPKGNDDWFEKLEEELNNAKNGTY